MLVSWEWLSDYVRIDVSHEEMAMRWALTGLNHESTEIVRGVPVIDLEITSNRGDCLGHLGVAREASVLLNAGLCRPEPHPPCIDEPASKSLVIVNEFQAACPRYIGRLIRGVKVGPSPQWLKDRLESVGVKSINNVVDTTNYVMLECGQPLHAFDFSKIRGGKIIVRPALQKEAFVAIDHRTYELDPQMVVIADAERTVALGGVMGGVDSEVSESTVDVLLEAAEFSPLCIRRTARKLKLHSPSSYRYERRVDGAQLDWASLRCCELILQTAGGKLCSGSVDTGTPSYAREPIVLRRAKIQSVLGIDVPWERSLDILQRLGCTLLLDQGVLNQGDSSQGSQQSRVVPPTYRADLYREIDLIEEIARIHGYEQIPEDAPVPLISSAKRPKDVMMQTVRSVACAAGFDETMTPSLIGKSPSSVISPWTSQEPLTTLVPLLEGAAQLRRSLIPSLIAARLYNQAQSNHGSQLFETANVYHSQAAGMPSEQFNLGVIGPADIRVVAGLFEEILDRVCGPEFLRSHIERSPVDWSYLASSSGIVWQIGGHAIAWIGQLHRSIVDAVKLDTANAVGELNLDLLLKHARLIPQLQSIVPFPTIERDLNLIVDESLQWKTLSTTIQHAAGPLCIQVLFREIYRDTKKDGEGKKRVLLSLHLRSATETLTSERADAVIQQVLTAVSQQFHATLLPVRTE
ncbi:MAG: phenylalanine--tRNA ligase subunit beta [Pirellula sp.]